MVIKMGDIHRRIYQKQQLLKRAMGDETREVGQEGATSYILPCLY
jgi:hypothetical protein